MIDLLLSGMVVLLFYLIPIYTLHHLKVFESFYAFILHIVLLVPAAGHLVKFLDQLITVFPSLAEVFTNNFVSWGVIVLTTIGFVSLALLVNSLIRPQKENLESEIYVGKSKRLLIDEESFDNQTVSDESFERQVSPWYLK